MNINKIEGEEWKDVHCSDQYLVSNFGRIYSLKTNKLLSPTTNINGSKYIYVSETFQKTNQYGKIRNIKRGKSREVGFLVAMAFKRDTHLNEQKVEHINGDNSDNTVKNVRFKDLKNPQF